MAWRSSGSTHEEMVDCLKRNGLISSEAIEKGFRAVDRKLFVPDENKDSAYSDQPLREGKIHISAPHIYCSALESLELEENSSTSFLNIGSGTGYLSCIVAEILGPKSLNYGVEIFEEAVEHSKKSIQNWRDAKRKSDPNSPFLHLDIVHGNVFQISNVEGECLVGFDRIYIGASVSRARLAKITKLLSPGGILVGPVDDELVKVIRIGSIPRSIESKLSSFESRNDDITFGSEFTQQVLSSVRFAPLVTTPYMKTVIPASVWSPSTQKYFPETFKKASNQIMLCSNSLVIQPNPPPKKTTERINLAAMLPKVVWLEILSFTHRKWFDSEETEVSYTKKRLLEEQNNAAKAHAARLEAERRCQIAERERDVYRLLARRWQSRLNLVLQQQRQMFESGAQNSRSTTSVSDRVMGLEGREGLFSFEGENINILFTASNNSTDDDEEDDEADHEEDAGVVQNEDQQMLDAIEDHMDSDDEHEQYNLRSHHSDSGDDNSQISSDLGSDDNENNSVYMEDVDDDITSDTSVNSSSKQGSPLVTEGRSQIRTVSMGSDDL